MTAALEGGKWSAARPGRTLPPRKTRYPFYRRLDGPQGRHGRAENLVPTGIRSRTIQPVVNRYTDWATQPIYIYIYIDFLSVFKHEISWKSVKWDLIFSMLMNRRMDERTDEQTDITKLNLLYAIMRTRLKTLNISGCNATWNWKKIEKLLFPIIVETINNSYLIQPKYRYTFTKRE